MADERNLTVDQARLMVIEASLPSGDCWYSRDEKRLAIRMILEEGMSYNLAESTLRKRYGRGYSRMALNRWVSEFESRVDRAVEMEKRLLRGGLVDAKDVKESANG